MNCVLFVYNDITTRVLCNTYGSKPNFFFGGMNYGVLRIVHENM